MDTRRGPHTRSEHEVLRPDSHVVVLGAGSIGLVAAKEVLAYFRRADTASNGGCARGHGLQMPSEEALRQRLVVLERAGSVGGVWRSSRTPFGNAYDSLHTNSSRRMMQLSDFPWSRVLAAPNAPPADLDAFPGHEEVCRYFQAYSDAHGLDRFIAFHNEVVKVERTDPRLLAAENEGGCAAAPADVSEQPQRLQRPRRWCVTYRTHHPSGGSSLHRRYFDVVFCCTGQYVIGVLVVDVLGHGCCRLVESMLCVLRYHTPKAPAVPGLASFRGLTLHSHDYHSPDRILLSVARNQPHHSAAASAVLDSDRSTGGSGGGRSSSFGRLSEKQAVKQAARPRVVIVGIGNSALDIALELCGAGAEVVMTHRSSSVIIPVAELDGRPVDSKVLTRFYQNSLPAQLRGAHFFWMLRDVNRAFAAAGLPPVPSSTPGHQVKFSNLKERRRWLQLLAKGRVSFRPQLTGLAGPRGARFADGSVLEGVGAVVFCTGYRLEYPFLSQGVPGFDGSVLRTYTVGESTVRWLNLHKRVLAPQLPGLCFLGVVASLGNETCVGEMQVRYMDDLAGDLGILPLVSWWHDPALWWKLWTGPLVPAQFRLQEDPSARARVLSRL